MKRICSELNVDTKKYDPRAILSAISNAKNAMQTATDYAALNSHANNPLNQIVAKAYVLYQKELEDSQALDFDDLIMKLLSCLKRIQKRWNIIKISSTIFTLTSIKTPMTHSINWLRCWRLNTRICA